MRFFPKSLTYRMTWFYGISTVILLITISGLLYQVLVDGLAKEDQVQIEQKINVIKGLLNSQPNKINGLEQEVIHEGTDNLKSRIIDNAGKVILASPGFDKLALDHFFPEPQINHTRIIEVEASDKTYLLASKKVLNYDNSFWTIQVAVDIEDDVIFNHNFLQHLIIAVVFGSIVAMLLGYIVTRKGLNPVKEITKAAERITVSQMHEKLDTHQWPDELKALAFSFDAMLNRLDESIQRLSQFSANLAHELRTPLHNLIGQTDVTLAYSRTPEEYQQVLTSNLEEYERLASILESLLFLARADNEQMALNKEVFDGREVLDALSRYQSVLAEEQQVVLSCYGTGFVCADIELFRRAVNNLISNALRHSSACGKIKLLIEEFSQETIITIQDSGQGISPEHIEFLGQRFYRAGAKDNIAGHGLGLAIVKSIMNLHEGKVEIESTLNVGTTVRLIFPR